MPIPTAIESLSTTAAVNGPAGTEQRTLADDGLRQAYAFIRQMVNLASLASATTVTPPSTAKVFNITGTTAITTIASTNSWDGREVTFIFAGILTFTHSANLALPGAASITTAANDVAMLVQTGSGAWRCSNYIRSASIDFDLEARLASTASASLGDFLVGVKRTVAGAVATTQHAVNEGRSLDARVDFGCVANGVANDTVALQAAIDAAFASGKELYIPPGDYLVTGLVLTVTSGQRGQILKMRGAGFGEPFYTPSGTNTTIIRSVTNAAVFRVDAPVTPLSAGTLDVSGIYFIGNSTTPVVHLEAFYGIGEFHHNTIYQNGVGNGLQIDYFTTAEVHDNYVLNRDLVTVPLYSARVGIGIYLKQNYDSGLATLRKNTCRGFLTGFTIGEHGASLYCYAATLEQNEVSTTYNGIILSDSCRGATVHANYLEGGEQGTGIYDRGDYNKVTNNFLFFTYATHIKSDDFTYGNVYTGNVLAAGTQPTQTLISITSSSNDGGPGKVCSGNHLVFGGSGGSIAGVIGLKIDGTDPRIDLSGNTFLPRGPWVGGAGTIKINTASAAASDGTAGHGIYGLGFAQSKNLAIEAPSLGRGAINLAVDPTALVNADIAAGVLDIGSMSVFTLTPSANIAITSFSAPNLPDKTFSIHVTATAFAVTFTQGTLLKLTGTVNFATGANGCWISFQIKPGGVAWETARIAY